MQKSTDFKNIIIAHIKKKCIENLFPCMNKHKAKKLINSFNPIDKMGSVINNNN